MAKIQRVDMKVLRNEDPWDITIPGFGDVAAAIIAISRVVTNDGEYSLSAGVMGYGFLTPDLTQCCCVGSKNGFVNQAGSAKHDSHCIHIADNDGSGTYASATGEMITDGIRITSQGFQNSQDMWLDVTLFGAEGGDLLATVLPNVTVNGSPAGAVTGSGFKPNCVFSAVTDETGTGGTTTEDMRVGMGIVIDNGGGLVQYGAGRSQDNGSSTTRFYTGSQNMAIGYANVDTSMRLRCTSLDADGFSYNMDNGASGTQRVASLCLQFADPTEIALVPIPAFPVAGNLVVAGAGFTPDYGMQISSQSNVPFDISTQNGDDTNHHTVDENGAFSFGAAANPALPVYALFDIGDAILKADVWAFNADGITYTLDTFGPATSSEGFMFFHRGVSPPPTDIKKVFLGDQEINGGDHSKFYLGSEQILGPT